MEGTVGEIRIFAGNLEPEYWAFCRGQLLSINNNTALFSIVGTTYGGDGRNTFGLPDLRGRVIVGAGQGSGLSNYREGQRGGQEQITLTPSQMPYHSHSITNTKTINVGNGNDSQALSKDQGKDYTGNTGGSQPIDNMQPWLTMNYIICLRGAFPSRS